MVTWAGSGGSTKPAPSMAGRPSDIRPAGQDRSVFVPA